MPDEDNKVAAETTKETEKVYDPLAKEMFEVPAGTTERLAQEREAWVQQVEAKKASEAEEAREAETAKSSIPETQVDPHTLRTAEGLQTHEVLIQMQQAGASAKEMYDFVQANPSAARGAEASQIFRSIQSQLNQLEALKGEEAFKAQQELGFIPKDAVYVPMAGEEWGYYETPAEAAEAVAYQDYQAALGKIPSKFISSEGAIDIVGAAKAGVSLSTLATITGKSESYIRGAIINQLHREQWMEAGVAEFETELEKTSPELFKIYNEKGYEAYKQEVARLEAEYNRYQAATPEEKLNILIARGDVPEGSTFAGIDDEGNPMYYAPQVTEAVVLPKQGKLWANAITGEVYNEAEYQALLKKSPILTRITVFPAIQPNVVTEKLGEWYETMASVPVSILQLGAKEYTPLSAIATDDTQKAAFGAIDGGIMAIRGGVYTAAAAITALPLFFLGMATDPVGTVKGVGTSAWLATTSTASILTSRAKLDPTALTNEEYYRLGSDNMVLLITALMLKGVYDMVPKGRFAARQVVADWKKGDPFRTYKKWKAETADEFFTAELLEVIAGKKPISAAVHTSVLRIPRLQEFAKANNLVIKEVVLQRGARPQVVAYQNNAVGRAALAQWRKAFRMPEATAKQRVLKQIKIEEALGRTPDDIALMLRHMAKSNEPFTISDIRHYAPEWLDATGLSIRANIADLIKRVQQDEQGYINLPGSSRAIINQLKLTKTLTKAQESSLIRILDTIKKAIADSNQIKLYDAGKSLLRVAKEVDDPTLIHYANDIINFPRSYIDGLEAISRTMKPEELVRKMETSEKVASRLQTKLKEITAKDVGLTETQFAEFLKQRVRNPNLTVEQFKLSLKPKAEFDIDRVIKEMTDKFNKRIKEEAARKVAAEKKAFEETQTILSRIKKRTAEQAVKEKAKVAKQEADLAALKRKLATKEPIDPKYAEKVGDWNKEIREHMQAIKERAKLARERVKAAEEAVEIAQKTGNQTKIAAATKLLEQLKEQLKEVLQEQTETETQLKESTKLVRQVVTSLLEKQKAELAEKLAEAIKESTEELQREKEEVKVSLVTPVIPAPMPAAIVEVAPPERPPEVPPVEPPERLPEEPPGRPPEKPPEEPPERPPEKPPEEPVLPILPRKVSVSPLSQPIAMGSIAWRQGMFWKYIPPPYDQLKPITLPQGVIPTGAKKLDGRTPQETVQMIGLSRTAKVPKEITVDLGITDIRIYKSGREIVFGGKGVQTNVGARIPSPTEGMSVYDEEGEGLNRWLFGTVSPKRTPKKIPLRKKKKSRYWLDDLTSVQGIRY